MKFEVPEPEEWIEYVKKGDLHAKKAIWVSHPEGKKNNNKNQEIKLGQKRLSRKDIAHMNFIESGKKGGRK